MLSLSRTALLTAAGTTAATAGVVVTTLLRRLRDPPLFGVDGAKLAAELLLVTAPTTLALTTGSGNSNVLGRKSPSVASKKGNRWRGHG
jgi:hypothetical protein